MNRDMKLRYYLLGLLLTAFQAGASRELPLEVKHRDYAFQKIDFGRNPCRIGGL